MRGNYADQSAQAGGGLQIFHVQAEELREARVNCAQRFVFVKDKNSLIEPFDEAVQFSSGAGAGGIVFAVSVGENQSETVGRERLHAQ